MRRRAIRCLLIAAAAGGAAGAPCAAQTDTHLDAALAYVKYDGYLGSGAALLSPSIVRRSLNTTLSARGTFLVFETGHSSLDGQLSADAFSAPLGPLRVEGGVDAGGSAYYGYAGTTQFVHALAHARLHLVGGRIGLFAGGLGGVVASPGADGGASGVSAGLWARGPAGALEISWTHVAVMHQNYSDLQGRARWQTGPVALEVEAGTRASGAVASGAFGDLSATLRLSIRAELIVTAGSYLSDPIRGTIGGRYATAGLRLDTPALARRREVPRIPRTPSPTPAPTSTWLERARVLLEQDGGQAMLVVYVAGVHEVEVTGDFTDWKSVALVAAGLGRYRYTIPLPAGVQHFNVRLDGGPWGVPQGAALEADDFGGSVGVLVVP